MIITQEMLQLRILSYTQLRIPRVGIVHTLTDILPQLRRRKLGAQKSTMSSCASSPSTLIYHWQEDVEDLEGYRFGGYHPVNIGDRFCEGRYAIVHKLGFGTFSTIWLAKDQKGGKYVAIKIATSESTHLSRECVILEYLARTDAGSSQLGKCYTPSLLDHFIVDGPNGRHQCLVGDVARCSLSLSKYGTSTNLFPLDVARAVAAQLILGVQYMHSRGVAHGGKFNCVA